MNTISRLDNAGLTSRFMSQVQFAGQGASETKSPQKWSQRNYWKVNLIDAWLVNRLSIEVVTSVARSNTQYVNDTAFCNRFDLRVKTR